MPTLLQINVTANWGSTGKIAESIGLAAMNHGWESYIAYGRMMNPSKSSLIKIGSKLDNYIHYAYDRLFDMEGRSSVRSTKSLIRKIHEIKPTVIQLHNIHDHFLNYKILFQYLNSTDIQVVWTFHDCWAFTGHCYHFVHYDCSKWKMECGLCTQRNFFVDRSRENFLLKRNLFDECKNLTIVPCSEWMENFVKDSFLGNKFIKVIHNGVDLNTFRPVGVKLSKMDHRFHILAVSNVWLPYKGEHDIYKLREIFSEEEFDITMVGLSSEQIKKLPKGICGIKRTQNIQQLVQLYSESDVLINPTYADTFPTVNLEALACGTPVITYETGGSPEAVDENTGIVVPQGNIDALVNAIQAIKKQPFSSETCRKRAELFFDKDKCFEQYIKLYNQLLSQK